MNYNFKAVNDRRLFYSDMLISADRTDNAQVKAIIKRFFLELISDRSSNYDSMILPYDKEIQMPFGKHEVIFSNYIVYLHYFRIHYLNGDYISAANDLWEINQSEPCFLRGTREGLIEAGKIVLGDDFPLTCE